MNNSQVENLVRKLLGVDACGFGSRIIIMGGEMGRWQETFWKWKFCA